MAGPNIINFASKVVFLSGLPITLPTAIADPGTAVTGDMYYNTSSNTIRVYDGSAWVDVGGGGGGGGANQNLDNLTNPTAINQNLLFGGLNGTYNIGASGASSPGSVFVRDQVRVGTGTDTPTYGTPLLFLDDDSNSAIFMSLRNSNAIGASARTYFVIGQDENNRSGFLVFNNESTSTPNLFQITTGGLSSMSISTSGAFPIAFSTNNVNVMTLDANGNLLFPTHAQVGTNSALSPNFAPIGYIAVGSFYTTGVYNSPLTSYWGASVGVGTIWNGGGYVSVPGIDFYVDDSNGGSAIRSFIALDNFKKSFQIGGPGYATYIDATTDGSGPYTLSLGGYPGNPSHKASNNHLIWGQDASGDIGTPTDHRPANAYIADYLQIGNGSVIPLPSTLMQLENDTNGPVDFNVVNAGTGAGSFTRLSIGQDNSSASGAMYYDNSTYTPSGIFLPNQFGIRSGAAATNGMVFWTGTAAPIKFGINAQANGFQWQFDGATGNFQALADNLNLHLTGSLSVGYHQLSGTGTISATTTLLGMTGTSGGTLTLPSAATVGPGALLEIKDEGGNAGTNNITIQRAGSDTIDGVVSILITADFGILRLYSNGINWFTR